MDKKQPAAPSYPWRNAGSNAGAMGAGQSSASLPALLGNLKARVSHMEGRPKEPLPKPSGDCGMCRTCSKHTSQQEAMVSMLSTQSRVLDSLQKNVLEMQRTLESLMRGLEERGLHTIAEKVTLPMGIQQRRKSLPMRMLADEVYVKLEPTKYEPSIPIGPLRDVESGSIKDTIGHKETKVAALPNIKQEKGKKIPSDVKGVTVNQIGPATPSNVKAIITSKNAMSEERSMKTTPASKPTVTSPSVNSPGSKEQSPSNIESCVPKPGFSPMDRPTLQPQTGNVGAGSQPAAARTDMGSRLQNSKPASEPAAKVTPALMKTVDFCTEKPAATPAIEDISVGKQMQVSPAQLTVSVKCLPKTLPTLPESTTESPSSLAPPNKAQLAVPSFTADAPALRHVQSCPESLQSSRPNTEAVPNKLPLPPKPPSPAADPSRTTAPAAAVGPAQAQKVPASSIQIRVSPAVEEKTSTIKAPPTAVLKVIDDIPPQPAPFPHRFVALKPNPPYDFFTVHTKEVLGGGRFGKVHKCTENATGLRLAAKIISTRSPKEKEMTLNEIQVMNQLSHANILQLYAAFEVKNQVILIEEYVEGGELFERIVDESSPLTEVDAMVFVRQICEGIHYMHQMYVLHLDLKPENILCVNRTGHQVKIIDFGLARRYKPREKLRVSFGTPEFLAPEIVNFDFVSFPTDMWTVGVITYMLISGLSPFLGDDDTETLNNVVTVNWYFDEDAFEHISSEAKDFISNLLIKERSGRFSAAQCLKHPWLNNISEKAKGSNIVLKSQVLLKKYMARRMWKKNYIAVVAANRFKKIASSGSLTSLGI